MPWSSGRPTLTIAAAWPYHQPSRPLLDAYPADPGPGRTADFTDVERQSIEINLS
ncbi:hypothetical protein ACFPH6_47215 [Streptomyces xiangluensis]|uniref:Uncharacterized protein n=1 Tax=Streptomyces xiangluensis TaxID=2665720 RepID=A0ABV8Z3D8_9ACTN